MKQLYTIKGLSELTNIACGTIRAWIMKPVDGQPYSSENVNYANLQEKLTKYFEDFETRFGFKVEDIEIGKAERSKKDWLDVETIKKLENGTFVRLHNYSLKTELMFIRYIEDLDLYIFSTTESDEVSYKTYDSNQLSKENIKIEKVEA